jgi:hypothetical protein
VVKGRLKEAESSPKIGAPRWGTAWVIVRGVLTAPGQYDNLGVCTHVLEVVEILQIIDREST